MAVAGSFDGEWRRSGRARAKIGADRMGWPQRLVALFDMRSVLLVALIFIPLERLFALHPEQPILRRSWRNDLFYVLINRVPIALGMTVAGAMILAIASWLVPTSVGEFVGGLSLWIQVPLAIVLGDFGFYVAHRLFHAIPWLWRFHAVHHSIEQMDWLASSRVHAVDQVITKGLSMAPLLLLGFSAPAIAIHALIYFVQSYFVHSNLRCKFGPFRWLVASPEFHHWHHSNQREAWNKNFAGQLPFLDALFGTSHMPRGQMPSVYGVDDPVPPTYLAQFAYPFLKSRRNTRRESKEVVQADAIGPR